MKTTWIQALSLTAVLAAWATQAAAVTEQQPWLFDNRAFLYVEAEDFTSLAADPENDGWKVVSKESPITSAGGLDILPGSSNVSGQALLDDVGGGQHTDKAVYTLRFNTPGTYQFYSRHSMYDSNGNNSFSNEDSIFVSPAFNKNSDSDWVGHQGLIFDENDPTVDIPDPGFALDPDGFKPGVGDSENEGWYAIRDWRIKSGGVLLGTGSQDPSLQNGNFNWYNRPALVSTGAGGGFDSDFGFKTEYTVTPAMVGQPVTFEIATREPYGVFDGFLFIQDDDVNLLDQHTQAGVDDGVLGGFVTRQKASDPGVIGGRNYLYVEAENFASRADDPDNNGWKVVSKESPVTSAGGLDILPSTSNVSGSALLDDVGGGQHDDKAVYRVQFTQAGTYQLYTRQTMYDSNGNNSFSNEDSIFISPAFDKNSDTDWVGFEGVAFDENDPTVDIPDPGFALDPDGFKPATGDSENEGWLAIRDWRIKSEGTLLGTGSQDPSLQNGEFHWYNRPAFVSTGVGGGFDSDFGFKTEYIVTEDMVGDILTFEIATREPYGVFDGFLFVEDDDVNLLDVFSQEDVDGVLDAVAPGNPADENGDGLVTGADFLLIQRDTPSDISSVWEPNYGNGVSAAAAGQVPEPASLGLLLVCGIGVSLVGRGRRKSIAAGK